MKYDLQRAIAEWSTALTSGDQTQIAVTINRLSGDLTHLRDSLMPAAWEEATLTLRSSQLLPILLQDPFTRWSYHRPRGFPADAGLIDFIYADGDYAASLCQASLTGRRIYAANQARPANKAVRFRRQTAAEFLREVLLTAPEPRVLAIAAGHMRELDRALFFGIDPAGRVVALDQDQQALDCIADRLPEVETLCHSLQDLLAGPLDDRVVDATSATGLYDYLSDAIAERLLAKQVALVRSGGRVLISNFARDAADRGYMEVFMDWKLIYRDEQDMMRLAERANPGGKTRVYREPSGQMVFLDVTKNG